MFINTSVFFTAALATIAAAAPTNLARDGVGGLGGGDVLGGDNCNANALCCDNYGSGLLGGLLGLNVDALTGNLGIGCIPIEVIALIPDNSCNAQSVCCEGTTFSNLQLIGLNCLPLKVL
ncbi:hypothetical protein F5J12DRAFT_911718 [Pisolithus orientalis]|uniref:uncharacterized protein n=1 Tax=Pisolithus orientalis TaxID=936130 RepID=UPI00222477CF|nr:uncharacterized protein F5J12DRAFT_911718 [Pisolithus orientalis]KAI6015225.1 hypothetical protein F5J12DRAFT_911718 [Pisolithus orientalis]